MALASPLCRHCELAMMDFCDWAALKEPDEEIADFPMQLPSAPGCYQLAP